MVLRGRTSFGDRRVTYQLGVTSITALWGRFMMIKTIVIGLEPFASERRYRPLAATPSGRETEFTANLKFRNLPQVIDARSDLTEYSREATSPQGQA
jgi:hypothetical protein